MKDVVVLIGAGSIGQAIARRVSAGRYVVLADLREERRWSWRSSATKSRPAAQAW